MHRSYELTNTWANFLVLSTLQLAYWQDIKLLLTASFSDGFGCTQSELLCLWCDVRSFAVSFVWEHSCSGGPLSWQQRDACIQESILIPWVYFSAIEVWRWYSENTMWHWVMEYNFISNATTENASLILPPFFRQLISNLIDIL